MIENDEKKVKEEKKNDELSIQNIGLSQRAVNSLDRRGIKLLNDLSNITEKDFHRIRGLGEKATNEIIDKMNEYGISFKRDTLYFEELGLSTRAVNSLESHGIKSIYELSNITKADLLEISDLGTKTINEIIEMMKKYEISFKYENDMLYIGNIGLSAKAFNILNRQRIGLLSELSNITEKDLYTIRGIGEEIANEIINKMKEHGITFKDDKKLASTMFDVDGKFNSAYDNLIEEIYGVTGNIQLYSSGKLQEEIDKLGGNMKQVLEMRYGLLEGTLPKTYEKIGKEIGVSKTRVGIILQKARRMMRHPIRTRKFMFICDFNEIKSNEFVTDEEKARIDEIEATLDKVCIGEKNIDDIDAKGCQDYLQEIKDRIEREKEKREKEKREKQEKEKREKQEKEGICIEDIGFSVRAYNCLKRYGINHLEDLSSITEEEFLKINGLGKKTVDEIKATMGEHGISFKDGAEIKIEGEDFPKIKRIRLEMDIKSSQNATEEQKEKEMGGIHFDDVGFSERAHTCLMRYGVCHEMNQLKDLSNITEEEFLKIRGIGNKTAAEVKYAMKLYGISFEGESKIDKGNVSKNEDESASIEDETESVDNNIEQQQEVQEGQQPKQEETSTNNKEELESMSAEELQKTVDENDKTIYENDQDIKKRLVERILEQQRIIAEQQNQINQLRSEHKEL